MFKTTRLALLAGFLALAPLATLAAPEVAATASGVVATVNGVPLTKDMLDFEVKSAIESGQQESPALIDKIKNHRIDIMALAQSASAKGLDKGDSFQTMSVEIHDEVLTRALIKDYLKRNPITDDMIKSEYDKEKTQTLDDIKKNPDGKDSQQLSFIKARQIQVGSQKEALQVLSDLAKGKPFDELAKKLSTDKQTANNGGSWGDVNRGHFNAMPGILPALDKLEPGQITPEPIQTSTGWHVLQLESRRVDFPSLDQIRPQMENAMRSKTVNAYVESVVAKYPNSKPSASEVDALAKVVIANGNQDSPQLRANISDKLSKSRALAAEARSLGLDKDQQVIIQVGLADQYNLALALVQEFRKNNPVTDDLVKAAYEKAKPTLGKHEIQARHILVKTEEEAKKLYATVKKHPKQFAELAKKHSIDTSSAVNGGDLGWVNAKQTGLVQQFSDALLALKTNEISKPVQTQFGWHIIQKTGDRESTPPLDQVSPQLKQQLEGDAINTFVADVRAKATIK